MVDKRKLGDLDCGEVTKKKQKKGNVDKSKNKDVEREKKSRTCKGRYTKTCSRNSPFTLHGSFTSKKLPP